MAIKIVYLKLEIKRLLKKIPQILAGAIVLSIVIGAVAFCAERFMSDHTSTSKVKIAVIQEDKNPMTNILISMLTNSEEFKTFCSLYQTSYEDGMNDVSNNKVIAAIQIPNGFLNSLSTGENDSISIYFSPDINLLSVILLEISQASQNLLSSAQAGIYSLYDYYEMNNLSKYQDEANDKLNSIYLSQVYTRENTYVKHTVSATGNLSLKNHYICSAIILFLLMLGTTLISYIKGNSTILNERLSQINIYFDYIILTKIIAVFLLYLFLSIFIYGITVILTVLEIFPMKIHILNAIINMVMFSLSIASFLVFLCSFTRDHNSTVLIIFLTTISCGFLTGCFIPNVFLPNALKAIGTYLPTAYFLRSFGAIFDGSIELSNTLVLGVITLICFIFAVVLSHLSERRKYHEKSLYM